MAKKGQSGIGFIAENSGKSKRKGRPENILRYRWPKGVSGNPGGRPKKRHFDEALEQLAEANPHAVKAIATHMFDAAQGLVPFCNGAVAAAKLVIQRVDGNVVQPISGPGGGPIPVQPVMDLSRLSNEQLEQLKQLVQFAQDTNASGNRG